MLKVRVHGPWYCAAGHHNEGSNATCYIVGCPHVRPAGIDASVWFYWLTALFVGPLIPIAGGLAWLAMAIANGIGHGLGWTDTVRWIALPFVGWAAFTAALPLERRISRNPGYRKARQAIRIGVLAAGIIWLLVYASTYEIPPAEIVGAIVAAPALFFLIRRFDLVFGLGYTPLNWNLPSWLDEFLHASNWRTAIVIGFAGGLVGLAIGRDARILAGISLWALVTVSFMIVSGGVTLLRNSTSVGKVLAGGVLGGGVLGWVTGSPFMFLVGAAAGVVVGNRWGRGRLGGTRRPKRGMYG